MAVPRQYREAKYIPRMGGYRWDVSWGDVDDVLVYQPFGRNAAVGTTEESIWAAGGDYVFPDNAGEAMSISSDDAADTSAGTGARTVYVDYLTTDFVRTTETLTMNGQTAVALASDVVRINEIIVEDVGSGDVNAGNLYIGNGTVTAGVPANIFGYVSADGGISQSAIITVPAGYQGLLDRFQVGAQGSGSGVLTTRLLTRPNNGTTKSRRERAEFQLVQASQTINFTFGILLDEKTDVEIVAVASSGSRSVFANFDIMFRELENDSF